MLGPSPAESVTSIPDTPFGPPPLPPRPGTPSLPPRLPPRPQASFHDHPVLIDHEKPSRRRCYRTTRLGRILLWVLIALVATIIAIVATICAVFLGPRASSDNGGHPLDVAHGGVSIGKPGDIAQFGKHSTDHFVLVTNRSSFVTRLDPIVNPGGLASHVHRVHGTSYFTSNLIKASDMQTLAKCSTTVVQDDKSAYWVAQLYQRFSNGTMASVPVLRTSLYYLMKAPTGVRLFAFPDNYNLVLGDPYRRSFNASSLVDQALWYQCYRGGGDDLNTRDFPDSACDDGLVQATEFCWDGVYADDADYFTHVTYPYDGPQGWRCPDAFPKKFVTIRFETTFDVAAFPYQPDSWILANGDTTGYGIHADFMNGWKAETLQDVLDNCRYMNATAQASAPDDPRNCPALNKTIDMDISYSCESQTPIVNETVSPVTALPGCNGVWSSGPKPPCPPGHIEGGELVLVQPQRWINNEGYI